VKRLIETNQKAAASRLVHAVQEMIQRYHQQRLSSSSVYQSPGDLLGQIQALIQNTETTIAKNRRTACRDRRQQYRERKLIEYSVTADLAASEKVMTTAAFATQVYDLRNAHDIPYYSSDDDIDEEDDDDDEISSKEMLSKSEVLDYFQHDVDENDDNNNDDDNDDKFDEGDDDDDDDDDHTRVDNSTDFDIDSDSDFDSDFDAVTVLHEMIHQDKVDEYELELFKDEDQDEDETHNDTDIDWENQDSTAASTCSGSGGYSTYTSGVSYGASSTGGYTTEADSEFETTDFDTTDGGEDTHGDEETDDELGMYSDFFSNGHHTDNFVEYDTDGNPTACGQTFDINTDKEDDDDDDDIVIQAHLSPQDKSILMAIEVELEDLKGMHEQEKKGWLYSTFFS